MTTTLREQLIGAWKLVSYVEKPTDGSEPMYPMGEKPQGIIMYTPACNYPQVGEGACCRFVLAKLLKGMNPL